LIKFFSDFHRFTLQVFGRRVGVYRIPFSVKTVILSQMKVSS
jgi:hypothetical protein